MKCGLLGHKLGHSYSPQIHSLLGSYDYFLFEKELEELANFLKNGDFSGLNVTIPYKKAVIPYLSELSPMAKRLGAVNTIVRREGRLIGHNTDYFGFHSMLAQSGLDVQNQKVLVLGSGGASNTAVAVLEDLGANPIVISRTGENNYQNLQLHADAAVIVNATPVGMYPNVGVSPIDLSHFPRLKSVLDIVYNPARTQLLLDAQKRGITTMNGLWMLVAQAKESAEWFTNSSISNVKIQEIHKKLRLQMENIILIGMPGSGKSTVGKLLAAQLGKVFADSDCAIIERTGMSIPEIFTQQGVDGFRAIETEVLAELGMGSGLVIATGGGCVTREENYPLLHQNATIFCLDRNIASLPTEGRPLSQAGQLEEMYRIRKPLYDRFADHHIDCNQNPETAAAQILQILEERT